MSASPNPTNLENAVPFEGTQLSEAPTLFDPRTVLAALTWKYGRAAAYVDVPSVWWLLDEYRARNRDKDIHKINRFDFRVLDAGGLCSSIRDGTRRL